MVIPTKAPGAFQGHPPRSSRPSSHPSQRSLRSRSRSADAAEGGTLGLLFFGATVLTGALIFAMFVGTTQKLSEEARDVADSTTGDLLPLVQLRALSGERSPGGDRLAALNAYVAPGAGARAVPLETLAVELTVPGGSHVFRFEEPPEGFAWSAVLDVDPALDPDQPVLSRGDTVLLRLEVAAAGLEVGPRAEGSLLFLAPGGRALREPFELPASLTARDLLELHGGAPQQAKQGWTFRHLEEPCGC